jgi:predicted DNA-binding ribbon-helix-helix protein
MRTTIRLDERLLRDLKRLAAARGHTLTAVIEEAVRQFLARAAGEGRPKPTAFRVITFKGALRSGADLDDSSALLDLMEGTAAPRRR